MLFTFFQWIWLILIVAGAALLALRPVMLRRDKTSPLKERTKAVLWFLQSLGFWAIVIGSWMRIEALVDELRDEEEEARAAKE